MLKNLLIKPLAVAPIAVNQHCIKLFVITSAHMDTLINVQINPCVPSYRQSVVDLLISEKLPIADLPSELKNFLIAMNGKNVVGVIGLEQHGKFGLLRSMAVHKDYRNRNIASDLVKQLEGYAIGLGLTTMYLLTETASDYFKRKGYQVITRDKVPEALLTSSEFSHVCPASATVMKKELVCE
jgi:amino-acid N-acetyltransferase